MRTHRWSQLLANSENKQIMRDVSVEMSNLTLVRMSECIGVFMLGCVGYCVVSCCVTQLWCVIFFTNLGAYVCAYACVSRM